MGATDHNLLGATYRIVELHGCHPSQSSTPWVPPLAFLTRLCEVVISGTFQGPDMGLGAGWIPSDGEPIPPALVPQGK